MKTAAEKQGRFGDAFAKASLGLAVLALVAVPITRFIVYRILPAAGGKSVGLTFAVITPVLAIMAIGSGLYAWRHAKRTRKRFEVTAIVGIVVGLGVFGYYLVFYGPAVILAILSVLDAL